MTFKNRHNFARVVNIVKSTHKDPVTASLAIENLRRIYLRERGMISKLKTSRLWALRKAVSS